MARVDVVMPVRNGARFIEGAVRSVISQSEKDWRLLILNHASTDSTGDIVNRFREEDRRVEVINFSSDASLSDVRNAAFERSDAEFVMVQDADDLSLPGRMETQIKYLAQRPFLAAVGGSYEIIDENDRTIGARKFPTSAARLSVALLFSNPIANPAVMLQMKLIQELKARYGASYLAEEGGVTPISVQDFAEDYLFYGQLSVMGLCANLPENVIRYRRHQSSVGIKNFDEQLRLSGLISEYLVRLTTARNGKGYFSPLPVCNHGARLFHVDNRREALAEWARLRNILQSIYGSSHDVARELKFRDILADRNLSKMLYRYLRFRTVHGADGDEVATIRHAISSWRKI